MALKKEKKLRIFINSNADWAPSGYAQQLAELLPHLVEAGYPTAVSAFYGLTGGIIERNGVVYYPSLNHVYGSDALVYHARDFKADVTFTLQDIWVLTPEDLQQTNRWIPLVPIDHDPVPQQIIDRLKLAYRIVVPSKFGKKEVQRNGLYSSYIPYTVNTTVFKPMKTEERSKVRQNANIADSTFLFGMVSANKDNPPRKSYQEVMDAFKMFLEKHPDSKLYIHTDPNFPGGFPIQQYAHTLGIQDKILHPDPYQLNFKIGKEGMAKIFASFDCLLAPSTNGGFEVPIIEAHSCGVPVITQNFTAMGELVEEDVTGWICKTLTKRFTGLGSYAGVPDTQSLYECMEKAFVADRKKMGKECRTRVVKQYDTKTIFESKWRPFLEKLEKEVYPDTK